MTAKSLTETFFIVKVTHDERFLSAYGKSMLTSMIAGRGYSIDGVRNAEAEAYTPVYAAGEGEVTNAHFINPADGARFIEKMAAPYREGIKACFDGVNPFHRPYPPYTLEQFLWLCGWDLAAAYMDGNVLDAIPKNADTAELPRLHYELMQLAAVPPTTFLGPNKQVPNARY